MTLHGTPVSEGVAIGQAYVYLPKALVIERRTLAEGEREAAVAAVERAVEAADRELLDCIASFSESRREQAKIFAAHREMLRDEDLMDTVRDHILTDGMCAECAVDAACQTFIALLSKVEDPNIALRTADVADTENRLIRCLRGEPPMALSNLPKDTVLVAKELLPSDTASMDRVNVAGIVTELGGATSHTAILARSFGIPALLGVEAATDRVKTGEALLLDAFDATLTLSPDAAALSDGRKKRERWQANQAAAEACRAETAQTLDGLRVEIGANIGSDGDEIPDYADFVGLFRTEFLYMNSQALPDEEEQYAAYCRVLKKAGGRMVTLRTLDIGGDKTLPYLPLPKEDNPFLGVRALRLCFQRPELLITQLRAAYRASAHGPMQMMFPMVGGLEDFRKARAMAEQVREALSGAGTPMGERVPLGVMIEIPSAALLADQIAKEADFASIGSNDLVQYLCAADRMNPDMGAYYLTASPAVLRALKMTADAFNHAGKPLSICGEMAGEPLYTALMIGLSLHKLSMNARQIAKVKAAVRRFASKDAGALAGRALELATQEEVLDACRAFV